MTAAAVAARLHGKREGHGWRARCPAHDDRRASLSIGSGADGRVLLHCHAQCTPDAICAAAGLELRDLFPDASRPPSPSVVATYDYHDEEGTLLFQVVRFDPKDFRQRRADGRWTLHGVRRVLFALPALQGQRLAYIVEGEKDAQALQAIGLVATTNPGGAGQWRPAYVDQLRTAGVERVIILPDNDEPGRRHAEAVARSCHDAGLHVASLSLLDLPPKGDVSDWLAAGHTREDLLTLVNTAPPLAPTNPVSAGTTDPRDTTPRPLLTCLADVQPKPVTWLWPGRLAAGKLALLVGDPGLGKSWISLDLAARLSAGLEWPDGGSVPAGSVLLLSAEDGLADTIRPRLEALGADIRRIHHLAIVRTATQDRAVQLADFGTLERAIRDTDARLMVIDPISAFVGATDAHRDAEVRSLLAPLASVADSTGAAILGIMHLAKDRQQPAIYRATGSIAFAAARLVPAVAADHDHEDRRIVAPVKANLSRRPAALAYSLATGRLVWEAEPVADADADVLLAAPTVSHPERREAEVWLADLLGDGPMRARLVQRAAREAGFVWRTVERAKTPIRD